MTSQYICRVASVYEFCLVLSFWSEPQPLLITSCVQSISLILATITKIMIFLSLLSEDLEREIKSTESMFFITRKDFMFIGRIHFEGLKAVLYKLSCELSQFPWLGKTRVDIELLITWVIHYLSTYSANGIFWTNFFMKTLKKMCSVT